MANLNEEGVSKRRSGEHSGSRPSDTAQISNDSRTAPSMTVATRRQTHEEQLNWEMALDVFLAELVRQHLGKHK